MGRIKRKGAYEHAQNVQMHINVHMRKVSSGHLLFEIFLYHPMIMFEDTVGPEQTAWMRRLIWAIRCPRLPKDTFSHGAVDMEMQCPDLPAQTSGLIRIVFAP